MVKLYFNLVEDAKSVTQIAQMLLPDGLGVGREWLRKRDQTVLGSRSPWIHIDSKQPSIHPSD